MNLCTHVRCVCVYSCVYEYAPLCRYAWRSEVDTGISFPIASQPYFLMQDLSLNPEFLTLAGLAGHWASEIYLCSCSPQCWGCVWITHMALMWILEVRIQVSCLDSEALAPRTVSTGCHFSKFMLCILLTNFIKMFSSFLCSRMDPSHNTPISFLSNSCVPYEIIWNNHCKKGLVQKQHPEFHGDIKCYPEASSCLPANSTFVELPKACLSLAGPIICLCCLRLTR